MDTLIRLDVIIVYISGIIQRGKENQGRRLELFGEIFCGNFLLFFVRSDSTGKVINNHEG